MSLHRLTSITLGVPDPDASSTFFSDFGLTAGDDGWFATRDGGDQLRVVGRADAEPFEPAVGRGDDPELVAAVARAVEHTGLGTVIERSDDLLAIAEPVTGLRVDVTVAEPYAGVAPEPAANAPGAVHRTNRPADSVLTRDPVRPSNLTHVVYGTPDQPSTLRFATEVLGFEVSDEVPGIIAFTRCGEVHHNLAIQAAPVGFVHHIAFETDSVDDVVRGGQAMVDADPDRHTWGLGRHAIGSNWFWYLRDPSGTFVEYTADVDRISEQDLYRPKEWAGHEFLYSFGPPTPSEFMEPADMADLIAASA